jgi:lipoate-protein ligase A
MTGKIQSIKGEAEVLSFDYDRELLARVKATGAADVNIYPFDREAVVAGRGSRLEKEIHLEKVRADGVAVYRRMGGGCSVFLDPGNLIVSIAFPAEGFGGIQTLFDRCSEWLIQGFSDIGIDGVYQAGISDLVINDTENHGRKIAGSCFYRTKGLAYYSAAILVTPDLAKMAAYLNHPPREPEYRKGRSHSDFVAGLNRFYPGITVDTLARLLSGRLDPSAMNAVA